MERPDPACMQHDEVTSHGNVHINVTLRHIRATIVAVEKQ